jgi:S-formylglutathione hydrolase FrmB
MVRRLIWVTVLLLPGTRAFCQGRIDCNVLQSKILKQTVHYCVQIPAAYDQPTPKRLPVLYFLHGLGDDEQTLFRTGGWALIDDLRAQHKIGDFLTVAPEGKASFYVNSADGKVRYGDFLLQEFMPYIEHKYRITPGRQGRGVTGISMGGYGALRLAFLHPELFSSVSAQGPALITASPQELDTAARSRAMLSGVLAAVFGNPINVPHWKANSPFVLAREHLSGLRELAIYFNCGQEDNYGFEKGAEALHRQLQAEGIKHEYHAYPGDHSATYFASHIAETMQFHSHAFAAKP